MERYSKQPPSKRNNYTTIGVLFPFGADFSYLNDVESGRTALQEKEIKSKLGMQLFIYFVIAL